VRCRSLDDSVLRWSSSTTTGSYSTGEGRGR
jgi:hypothetical protein